MPQRERERERAKAEPFNVHGNPITGHYFVPCHLTTRCDVAFYLSPLWRSWREREREEEGGWLLGAFVMRAVLIIIILYFICFCERQKYSTRK